MLCGRGPAGRVYGGGVGLSAALNIQAEVKRDHGCPSSSSLLSSSLPSSFQPHLRIDAAVPSSDCSRLKVVRVGNGCMQ